MCLITFALQQHPDYPLVMVANRDEFYTRPTQSLHAWQEHPDIVGGRDLEQGGSWLAVNAKRGKLAAVTNVRNGREQNPPLRSRGHLIRDFLNSDLSAAAFAEQLQPHAASYGPFNLLLTDSTGLHYLSNRSSNQLNLAPAVYGLSNASLNTPWPKLTAARTVLTHALATRTLHLDSLVNLLSSPQQATDEQLPDTGISLEWERLLSSCFIHSEHYGTRACTVVLLDTQGQLSILEQCFGSDGKVDTRTQMTLQSTRLKETGLFG